MIALGSPHPQLGPGPSTLPLEVLEEAQQELVDYAGSRMSLLEMSHRGGHYEQVHAEAGLVNLKGYRSVGGCRASLYNALPEAAARALAEFMTEFRSGRG